MNEHTKKAIEQWFERYSKVVPKSDEQGLKILAEGLYNIDTIERANQPRSAFIEPTPPPEPPTEQKERKVVAKPAAEPEPAFVEPEPAVEGEVTEAQLLKARLKALKKET